MVRIPSRQWIWWFAFGVMLLATLWGWLWIVQRLVRNDAELAEARLRVAEERFLSGLVDDLGRKVEEAIPGDAAREEWIPKLAREGVLSGVWFDGETQEEKALVPKATALEWQERIRAGAVSPEEFSAALESGELEWGWVEEGRDAVAGMALSLVRRHPDNAVLLDLLEERVWDYGVPALKSGFRLLMIRPLQGRHGDPSLDRLAMAERIRVQDGRVDGLESGPLEVLEVERGDGRLRTYWTRAQLEGLLGSTGDEAVELVSEAEGDRVSVRVQGFSQWPFLTLRDGGFRKGVAEVKSGSALFWMGGVTGLAVLVLTVVAAIVANRASRLARMRTDLAASVAHELRTPLAGQRLLLESSLDRKDQSGEQQREYMEMALRENKRLSRLAEEFLTFSRLERGILKLESEEVDIRAVVENAVSGLQEKLQGPDCHFEVDLPGDLPVIQGDREAIATVLRNLLENAWKYSEAPREIRLRGWAETGGVWLSVKDNGIGLSVVEKQRVFRQFYRSDRRLARTRDGLGLGLSIVRRLVKAMDGRIELESAVGKGSEFRVWLKGAT